VYTTRASNSHWERLLRVIGREDLLGDPRFATAEARHGSREALAEVLAAEFSRFTRAEILELAERHRLTIGPVYDVLDALEDEHYRARETIVRMDDDVVLHNVVPRLSRTPGEIRLPAPRLGEHNEEVYGALGLDADELAELASEGVI